MEGIIQVAIGLILVFSLLSILVTTLNTVITNALQWRAAHLKVALQSLITDPEVLAQFLSHPLINIIKTEPPLPNPVTNPNPIIDPNQSQAVVPLARTSGLNTVNSIDPKIFAQVLSSILSEKAGLELYGPLLLAADALPDPTSKQQILDLVNRVQNTGVGLPDLHAAIVALPADQQPSLLAALKPIEDRGAAAQVASTDGSRLLPVIEGLRKVNDDAFRRALKVIVGSAESFDQAQTNLSNWFNQRMDQISEVYKRNVTYLTLAIGLIIALILNADSMQIGVSLWNDPTLRAAITTVAQTVPSSAAFSASAAATPEPNAAGNGQIIAASAQQLAASLTQLTNLNLPIGWEYTPITVVCYGQDNVQVACPDKSKPSGAVLNPTAAPTTSPAVAPTSEGNATATVAAPADTTPHSANAQGAAGATIRTVCLAPDNTATLCDNERNLWLFSPVNNPGGWFGLIIRKLLGMAVTVIAIGQGAPFWFDLLRRLVNPSS